MRSSTKLTPKDTDQFTLISMFIFNIDYWKMWIIYYARARIIYSFTKNFYKQVFVTYTPCLIYASVLIPLNLSRPTLGLVIFCFLILGVEMSVWILLTVLNS